jgi:hypothetical protein
MRSHLDSYIEAISTIQDPLVIAVVNQQLSGVKNVPDLYIGPIRSVFVTENEFQMYCLVLSC